VLKESTREVLELPKIKNVKYIYVDEAQDLNKTEYEFIKMLQDSLGAKVCMVGDLKQSIY
jgi:superfamily I DNA/RNA helicase